MRGLIKIAPQKLKQIRKRSGISVDDVCKRAKISYAEYIAFEHGSDDSPSHSLVDSLSKIFKCKDTDLLVG